MPKKPGGKTKNGFRFPAKPYSRLCFPTITNRFCAGPGIFLLPPQFCDSAQVEEESDEATLIWSWFLVSLFRSFAWQICFLASELTFRNSSPGYHISCQCLNGKKR